MKETLTCSVCSKNWKREITRGRKPTSCPRCLKAAEKEQAVKQKTKTVRPAPVPPAPVEAESPKPRRGRPSKVVATPVEAVPEPPVEVQPKVKVTLAMVYRDYYPKGNQELIESTKKGAEWECKACNKHFKTVVSVATPPTHHCPPNSTRIKEYERVS